MAGQVGEKERAPLREKTTVFANPDQIEEVRRALAAEIYSRVLVIGTSRKMIQRIAKTLGLLPIHRVINIHEVSTRGEIERAPKIRAEQGKHIIPVPGGDQAQLPPHLHRIREDPAQGQRGCGTPEGDRGKDGREARIQQGPQAPAADPTD